MAKSRIKKDVKVEAKVESSFLQLAITKDTDTALVIEYLRMIVEALEQEKCVKKGRVFRTLSGAMDARLKKFGIKHVADWLLLMQFTGVARYYKERSEKKPVTYWQVLRNKKKLLAEFIEEPVVRKAVLEVLSRRKRSKQVADLNRKITQLENQTTPTSRVTDINSGRKVAS